MSNTYSGSCLCQNVKFEIHGDFESFFLCHCTYCQKDTGSAHSANLFSTKAKLVWLSGKESIKTYNLPSTRHAKSFCPNCSSAVPNQPAENFLQVPAGSLDTPVSIKPNAHIFVSSKASWEDGLESVLKFATFPS